MTMFDITLTIGHNVGETPTHDRRAVCEAVALVCGVDAMTAWAADGVWRGMAEQSTRVLLAGLDAAECERVKKCVPALAALLGQEAIMFECRESAAVFVEAAVA